MARAALPPKTLIDCFIAVMPPECGAVPFDAFARAFWRVAPGRVRLGLHGVCFLLRLRAFWGGPSWERRTPDERRAVIAAFGASRNHLLREIPVMFKALAAQGAFGHPAGQAAFGLPVDTTPPFWAP